MAARLGSRFPLPENLPNRTNHSTVFDFRSVTYTKEYTPSRCHDGIDTKLGWQSIARTGSKPAGRSSWVHRTVMGFAASGRWGVLGPIQSANYKTRSENYSAVFSSPCAIFKQKKENTKEIWRDTQLYAAKTIMTMRIKSCSETRAPKAVQIFLVSSSFITFFTPG